MKTNYYSFHTFELQTKIEKDRYRVLKDNYYKEARRLKYRCYQDSNTGHFIVEKYSKNGVIIKLKKTENGAYLSLRINPRRMNGESEYLGIFEVGEKNVDVLLKNIEAMLINENFKPLYEFKVRRLDFCTNYYCGSQEVADDIMNLMILARPPKNMRKDFYVKEGKRDKGGVYFKASDFELYVYNKTRQLENISLKDAPKDEFVVRYEIRLERPKIRSLEKRFEYNNIKSLLCSVGDFSYEYFKYYIPQVFLCGRYVSYSKILETIHNSSFNNATKEMMHELCDSTMRKHDLGLAIMGIAKEYSLNNKNIKNLLKHFEILNVNPITISKRSFSGLEEIESVPRLLGLERNRIMI